MKNTRIKIIRKNIIIIYYHNGYYFQMIVSRYECDQKTPLCNLFMCDCIGDNPLVIRICYSGFLGISGSIDPDLFRSIFITRWNLVNHCVTSFTRRRRIRHFSRLLLLHCYHHSFYYFYVFLPEENTCFE
jgi:hypothetical protein